MPDDPKPTPEPVDPRIQEVTMALLSLTMFGDESTTRAWKGHAWSVMDALFERGWIHDPKGKAKSVLITAEGERKAEEFFEKYFGDDQPVNSSQSRPDEA